MEPEINTSKQPAGSVPLVEAPAAVNAQPALRPWSFWATTLWAALAALIWVAAQIAIGLALIALWDLDPDAMDMDDFVAHAVIIVAVAIGSTPAAVAIFGLAVRFARWPLAEYLALVRPARGDLILGLLCIVVLLPLFDLTTHLSGREIIPDFMLRAYASAQDHGIVPLLAIALVVAAPIGEEIAFRGFIYRGWAASPMGPVLTIMFTSALWAAMHTQYETFFVVQIFCAGLVLGYLRWRSGSALLTIGLHAIINASALVQTAAKVNGWF